ncbi:MAG: hypothetical protein Q8S71_10900 [Hydrogenophaga sp.]|nr:hypothetical protein [Hydrogenophaga sp.]MDP3324040.1 hypothetical protein [Hydrogenophaga sp.]
MQQNITAIAITKRKILMSKKYNQLPGASHFQPFFSGESIHLHFSYTETTMYCKVEVMVDDRAAAFVEARELEEESKASLDAMASDDYIGPTGVFANLSGEHKKSSELDELLSSHKFLARAAEDLRESLKDLDPQSEEQLEVAALMDYNNGESFEARVEIERIIDSFNRTSGYDPEFRTITVKRQSTT